MGSIMYSYGKEIKPLVGVLCAQFKHQPRSILIPNLSSAERDQITWGENLFSGFAL